MGLYGYGKILEVNLSTGKITKRNIEAQFARDYVGGMGFGCKLLWDEVGLEIEPFSPDNILVFANGPLTGTHAPASGRTEITTRSPLTGTIGTGNTGGLWGARLKHAGFDMLVVRKRSETPVYMFIDDDRVELRDARHLWGLDIRETTDVICKELGDSQISVLAIGPAGENQVRYACVINDYYHAAARGSAGAIAGDKNLKAIAVRGSGTVSIARPEEFKEVSKEARERLLAADKATKMPGAPSDSRKNYLERGSLPARNYQSGVLPQWLETRGQDIAWQYFIRKEGTCYACPTPCFNLVEVKEGKYAGLKVNRGTMPGVVIDWGAKCAVDNLPAIWKCKELCQRLGLDYVSTAGSIAFAMELFQRNIITQKDTDGLELTWGNEDAVTEMIYKIAHRKGFGDVLAEGSVRAAQIIGKGAEKYVMTIKGMEMMGPDPRAGAKGWLLGSLTNPRGGDNIKNTHTHAERYNPNWWIDKFDMPDDVKKKIYSMPTEQIPNTWEGKPLMCKWFEDMYSILNSLDLCFFPSGFRLAVGPTHLAKLYSACTGWDTSPEEILILGEKVFNLFKAISVRYGLTRADDNWPERFYTEPVSGGPAEGRKLSRDEVVGVLDEYYGLRGWDEVNGMPTERKLAELGLQDIADELKRMGKLP